MPQRRSSVAAWLGKLVATAVFGPGVAVIGDPGVQLTRGEIVLFVVVVVAIGLL